MKIGKKTDVNCILAMEKKTENINEWIRLALEIGVLEKMVSARMKQPEEINENWRKGRSLKYFMNEKKNGEY